MLVHIVDDRRLQAELGRVRPGAFRFVGQELVDRFPDIYGSPYQARLFWVLTPPWRVG